MIVTDLMKDIRRMGFIDVNDHNEGDGWNCDCETIVDFIMLYRKEVIEMCAKHIESIDYRRRLDNEDIANEIRSLKNVC